MKNYNKVGNLIDAAKLASLTKVPLELEYFTRKLHANVAVEVMVKTVLNRYAYLKLNAGNNYSYSVGSIANGVKAGDISNKYTVTEVSNGYKYTYTTDGVDPAITALSVPVGITVTIENTALNNANNGNFKVVESGDDYFVVANNYGVVEATAIAITTGRIVFHTRLNYNEVTLEF
jgi:fibronectin type 3 domain-containing protein